MQRENNNAAFLLTSPKHSQINLCETKEHVHCLLIKLYWKGSIFTNEDKESRCFNYIRSVPRPGQRRRVGGGRSTGLQNGAASRHVYMMRMQTNARTDLIKLRLKRSEELKLPRLQSFGFFTGPTQQGTWKDHRKSRSWKGTRPAFWMKDQHVCFQRIGFEKIEVAEMFFWVLTICWPRGKLSIFDNQIWYRDDRNFKKSFQYCRLTEAELWNCIRTTWCR